jgi:aromatic-L-amino-acid decarboxylase
MKKKGDRVNKNELNLSFTDLELSPEAMVQIGEAAVKAIVEHIKKLPEAPSFNLENSVETARSMREPPPERGADFASLLAFLMHQVIPLSIATPHPGYLAYIPGGGLYPSAIADFIAAATNRYVGAWFPAPAAARLEANVLEWFAQWMQYPQSARGILTSGGSLANFSAIVAARRHLLGDDLSNGTIYATNQAHLCIIKAAVLAGIPQSNIRILDVDENFRAIPDLFESAIKKDQKKGMKPFLIISSAGTTNTGAVDPLPDLASIAKSFGLWHHIDAAYGGFFNLCAEGKKILRGIDQSDSIVLDPHKGLFVPYGTGSLLVKDGELLRQAHMFSADYLQDLSIPEGEINATDYSPELSRSFRGLRVWLPLKLFGVQAFRENLAEKLRLTKWMYQQFLKEPGFECFSEPELSVIAFRYHPKRGEIKAFNRQLLEKINNSKRIYLSSTMLRGEFAIRVCILSFRTHQAVVEEAFEIIKTSARKLDSH